MTELIDILEKHKKITKEMSIKIHKYLREVKAPVTKDSFEDRIRIPFEKRAELSKNLVAKQLFNIMSIKKTNLCLSVDLTSSVKILELLEKNTEKKLNMASKNPNIITGFVCQNKDTFKDPGLLQLTPGVQLESAKDDLGQVYNTPEKVILENGADIVVVGRGIVNAKSPEAHIVYRDALWKCYSKRISGKLE
ncbi:uncharacterized protein LOC131847500 [Achroia grisella]|uniref:uncharacterized protein LOC131847500 n=1 Tax=Achroia grisella TaxID=688607 RepID=UPI0027D309DE|nr:uncharacterized protein LOC131847500 [Achroia grisella]